MKKLFAILAVMGVLTLGSVQPIMAQDEAPAQTEQTAVVEEGGGLHKELKTKFIEGDASFMSLVAIALVLGLAFCIERIIYLSLAEVNTKKLMANIEAALEKGDVEAAKTVCRNTRGPVASICYQDARPAAQVFRKMHIEVKSDSGDYLEVLADSSDEGHVYCVCSIKNKGGEFALKNESRVMSLGKAFDEIPGFALICED